MLAGDADVMCLPREPLQEAQGGNLDETPIPLQGETSHPLEHTPLLHAPAHLKLSAAPSLPWLANRLTHASASSLRTT